MIIYVYQICKFVFNYRVDKLKEHFGFTNLFSLGNGNFLIFWNMNNYHITYSNTFENGLEYKTKSCTIYLSLYGSTIGATRYPQFIKDDEYKILLSLYHTSKPGNKGWKLVKSFWFLDSINHIDGITFQYFINYILTTRNNECYYIWYKKRRRLYLQVVEWEILFLHTWVL